MTLRQQYASEYRTWCHMIDRCRNKNHEFYHRYGGRGVRVCKRWAKSFDTFLADMGPKPTSTHTIERKDNDGNYEPGNCAWATRSEQGQNTCQVSLITYKGESHSIRGWARKLGIGASTIRARMKKMSAEEAVSFPAFEKAVASRKAT